MGDIKKNKELCEKYPFLVPRNVFTDEVLEDYDYSYTEWDAIPDGWKIAFGDMMLEEIGEDLHTHNCMEAFRIEQIKEKFGGLHLYFYGGTDRTHRIIEKYSTLSENICIKCGKPDVYMTGKGWICPFCKECYESNKYHGKYEDAIDKENDTGRMADVMRWRTSVPGQKGWTEYEEDISETAERIRENWRKRNGETDIT